MVLSEGSSEPLLRVVDGLASGPEADARMALGAGAEVARRFFDALGGYRQIFFVRLRMRPARLVARLW